MPRAEPRRPYGVTIEEALRRAHLTVSLPVAVVLIGPVLLQWWLPTVPTVVWVAVTPVSVVVACAWWAWQIPRWRVWALEHVADPRELLERAVKDRLMWPPDHPLARAEILPDELRRRERELKERRRIHPSRPEPTP